VSTLSFCFPTTFYPPYHFGGDAIAVQRLATGLVRQGHRVTVVHDIDAFLALGGKAPGLPVQDDEGVKVIGLKSRLRSLSPLLTQQLGRPLANRGELRRILSDPQFDVINYHNLSLIGGPALLAYPSRAAKLYMAHEHWLVCPTHALWRHNREPCPARQCVRCQLIYRRPPQLWRMTGLLERNLPHVSAFIAVSEFSRRKHREFGFPREMLVLPGMAPDPMADASAAERTGTSPSVAGRPYFLFVGRLEKLKGLQDVIPLFRSYQDADLVVIGEGGYRPDLETLAAGIPGVRFLGRMEQREISRHYAGAVATIVPSVTFESFGIVVVESLAHRTPVIARELGPLPELIEQSGGGALFSTPAGLLQAMQRMQHDITFREECARDGYAAFRERWSEAAVIPRYLEIVREQLSSRAR
jgi:glycosyltransferase involved in cell wall biosynthesis